MALLHPRDGKELRGNMSVPEGGTLDDHREAKARCIVQPTAFLASWLPKSLREAAGNTRLTVKGQTNPLRLCF